MLASSQTTALQCMSDFNFEAFTEMIESHWRHHGLDCRTESRGCALKGRDNHRSGFPIWIGFSLKQFDFKEH